MARPRIADNAKKTYRLIIRLSADERKSIETVATTKGLKAYAYGRLRLLNDKTPKTILAEIDQAVYFELKKIGVNLNQLTLVANSGRFCSDKQIYLPIFLLHRPVQLKKFFKN